METASRLFYTQGYNNTGINQLIKEAKVAKASFYEYFPSKEDLLVEYLKAAAEQTNRLLKTAVEKAATPREKVLAVFDHLMQRSRQTQYNGCNFLNILAEIPLNNKEVKTLVRSQKDHIRSLFSQILGRGKKDRLADELYLLFDAALSTSKVYEDSWPIEASKRLAAQLM
ncbi:MAG: TetR/AcrR family transcriptional regulator [Bacteroidota bacterium]|nr:TetR/AcrR family transcriptional regulator [Bacteroidota bacterium]MDP4216326.1 TetR/AcrR family transcriptional regulator [Bacteroidota bacterium]